MTRLQAELERLQAALNEAACKDNVDGKNFDALYCGTLNGWSAGIKCEADSDKPIAVFLLEGERYVIRLTPEVLRTMHDFQSDGAITEKLLEIYAKSL